MEDQQKYIDALIKLHSGLARQGPGSPGFTAFIIGQLADLPPQPRIADMGCGAGAGALTLAGHYHSSVKAVDFSNTFLSQMMHYARLDGLDEFIEPVECDIGSLDWEPASIDLLWSEGAAYTIGFENAIKTWRPLLAANGIAVISEMNYFSENIPSVVTEYMQHAYPDIKTEAANVSLINASGFEVLSTHRLPSKAWWDNYYDPLQNNITVLRSTSDKAMLEVIRETEEEMAFFKTHHEDYGYTYYLMQAR